MYLPQFHWYDMLRPATPDDIYELTEEQKRVWLSVEGGTRRRSGSNAATPTVATDTVSTTTPESSEKP